MLEISSDCRTECTHKRNSHDKVINDYGKKLLTLCQATETVILNGRAKSDSTGKMTCYTYNGSSVVDYVLCSREIFNLIDLRIDDISPLSDHCMLHTTLTLPGSQQSPGHHVTHLDHKQTRAKWKPQFKDDYINNLSHPNIQQYLNTLYTTLENPDALRQCILRFTNILLDANHKVL